MAYLTLLVQLRLGGLNVGLLLVVGGQLLVLMCTSSALRPVSYLQ